MSEDLQITLTDAPTEQRPALSPRASPATMRGKAGFRDYKPLAVLVSDPESGALIGGLYGRTSLGVMFIDRFFLPETQRRGRLGSRLLDMAEAEGSGAAVRSGRCSRCISRRPDFTKSGAGRWRRSWRCRRQARRAT